MISLKSLIPEIKIVPNTKEPREGDQWYWKNNPKHINTIVSITNEGHQITFIYESPDGSPIGPVSLQSLKEYIKMGEIKLVRATNEIKIIPQLIIPKLGDKYEVLLGDNEWHQGIITRVPYDEWTGISLTYPNKGYGQGKAEMGIGDIKRFNELIREKRLRKIKDINEIKIVSNSIPQNNEKLYEFLLKNKEEFRNYLHKEGLNNLNIDIDIFYDSDVNIIELQILTNLKGGYLYYISLSEDDLKEYTSINPIKINFKGITSYII